MSLRLRNHHPRKKHEGSLPVHIRQLKAFKQNVLLLKIVGLWENMFKFDLLDTLHIPLFCSGFLSSCKEESSELSPWALLLHLWKSLPIVKTDTSGVIYVLHYCKQQVMLSPKRFDMLVFGMILRNSLPGYPCVPCSVVAGDEGPRGRLQTVNQWVREQ